jgi:SHS family lactate transporter-like MFS transporter
MSTASTARPLDGPASAIPVRREVVLILVFAFFGTLFDGAELNLVGYPLAYLSDSFHVSTIEIIRISTIQGFASIAGGLLFGWLGDQLGRRWTYTISVLIFGIAAILGGIAPTYAVFLLTRVLAGVGMGGLFGLSFSMFAECWKTQRRGAMGGAIQAMYFVGEIVTEGAIYFSIKALGGNTGWRTGYVLIGVGTMIVAVLAAVLLPESRQWQAYQAELRSGRLPEDLRRNKVPLIDLFRRRYAYGTIAFIVLSTAMFLTTNSITAYLSTFLIKVQKLPLGTASLIVLIGLIVTPITYLAGGILSDVIRRKWAFFLCCAFGLIGFTWFLVLVQTKNAHIAKDFWHYQTFWALMFCAAATGGFGILGIWMAEFFPTRVRSTGSNASYYAGRGLGAGVYPLFALSIAGAVPLALALGIIGPIAGVIFSIAAPDKTGRTITAIE